MLKNIIAYVIVIFISVFITVFTSYYILNSNNQSRYIINDEVFKGFDGTKHLQNRITRLKESNQQQLDSLMSSLGDLSQNNENQAIYLGWVERLKVQEETLANQYTADIWKNINTYVADFGKKNGYSFIYGATGNGALMYADSTLNVTEELVFYMNEKYINE